MPSISIKGVVVGNLFALAAGLTTKAAVLLVFAAPYEGGGFDRLAGSMSSSSGLAFGLASSGLIGISAGFLSARVAGRGELTNGTLSSILTVAQGLYAIVCWPDQLVVNLLGVASAPLVGLLGGYLRLRQVPRSGEVAANATSSISIKSVVIGALTNLVASWVLGSILLSAAMASYDLGADNVGDNPVGSGLYLLTLGAPPLMAGYVAAAIARKSELINGTLVGVLCAVVVLLFDLVAPQEWETVDPSYFILLAPLPVLSFIGACLYLVFGWPKHR